MRVLTPERMREIERRAIEGYGIDGLLLMERAALALAEEVLSRADAGGRSARCSSAGPETTAGTPTPARACCT